MKDLESPLRVVGGFERDFALPEYGAVFEVEQLPQGLLELLVAFKHALEEED